MVECGSMHDVRREIDRLDRALVKLLAERQGYIEQAGKIKTTRNAIRDTERIEDVVARVLACAEKEGLSAAIAEPVWRLLIEKSIAHEYGVFDARSS